MGKIDISTSLLLFNGLGIVQQNKRMVSIKHLVNMFDC